MRPTLRILFSLLTILSLLLSLAFAALWVRSYWRSDLLVWAEPLQSAAHRFFAKLSSGRGGIAITTESIPRGMSSYSAPAGWRWVAGESHPIRHPRTKAPPRSGFAYEGPRYGHVASCTLIFPTALPTILFALLPLARGALFIRHRQRLGQGRCKKSGYTPPPQSNEKTEKTSCPTPNNTL